MGDITLFTPNLIGYMPPHYGNSNIMQDIQKSAAIEIGKTRYSKEELFKQFFIDTATWGLSAIWEKPLGIEDLNKSIEERREIVKAKLRGFGTISKKMLKNTAEAFSGGECDVIEHPGQYTFTIKFVGVKGVPQNMNSFKEMIEAIKPAHLAYKFEYSYLNWDQFENYNTNFDQWDASNLTWDQFEVYQK